MKSIEKMAHICVPKDGPAFYKEVHKVVEDMQKMGLEVEVQYQTLATASDYAYTAIILGRKEVK